MIRFIKSLLFGKSVDGVVGKLSKLAERLEHVQKHHTARGIAAEAVAAQARAECSAALNEADRAWRVRTNIKKLIEG